MLPLDPKAASVASGFSSHLRRVRYFSDVDMHESAILLGSILVSLAEEGHARCHAKLALGNALRMDGQFKRAVQAYQDALHEMSRVNSNEPVEWGLPDEIWKFEEEIAQHEDDMAVENDSSVQELDGEDRIPLSEKKRRKRSLSPQLNALGYSNFQAHIKFRMAQCYVAMDNSEAASAILESCARESLFSPALALLGKIKRRGNTKGAPGLMTEALEKDPLALEVMLSLLEMEVDANEVFRAMTMKGQRRISPWLEQLVWAHGTASRQECKEAVQRFAQLGAQTLPGNVHVLTQLARCELQCGHRDAALHWFERVRSVDSLSVSGMDEFAGLLKQTSDRSRLIQLTHELLGSGSTARPEPWVAAAHLSDLKGEFDRSLTYVQRAIDMDARHVPALHLKGNLLVSKKPLESLSCFAHALQVRRDFDGLKGLAEAYLNMSPAKYSDAIMVAKEAVSLMPHDARAFILMARALAHQASTEKLAVEALLRALRIDMHNVQASALLADVRVSMFKRGECNRDALFEAAAALTRLLQTRGLPRDELYCRIGKLFEVAGERGKALENFHDALSVNPSSEEAKAALEALDNSNAGSVPRSGGGRSTGSRSYVEQSISPSSSRRSPGLRLSAGSGSPSSPDTNVYGQRRRLVTTGGRRT